MKENLIIIHGGGPTAVLNCSLYGAVREAQASGLVEHVYGAVGGTGGLLKEKLLDFGSVPEEELERLPGTGPAKAEAIAAYRTEHGPFRTVDQLMEVSGIGEATLEALRPYITASAPA